MRSLTYGPRLSRGDTAALRPHHARDHDRRLFRYLGDDGDRRDAGVD